MTDASKSHPHFGDQDALQHMVERQKEGIITSSEVHGSETPGTLWAAADAAREVAIGLTILWIVLLQFQIDAATMISLFILMGAGLGVWRMGRSSLLGWHRLERLHRVLEEERWEIEHNREQEREELKELYHAKGFEGKLLDDVIEVLMADGDRLLKVMLQEELGLELEVQEHPLQQGLCALAGASFTVGLASLGAYLYFPYGAFVGTALAFTCAALLPAWYERNRLIPALVWNLGVGALACGLVYFLLHYFRGVL
jgi:hypothetical protein